MIFGITDTDEQKKNKNFAPNYWFSPRVTIQNHVKYLVPMFFCELSRSRKGEFFFGKPSKNV